MGVWYIFEDMYLGQFKIMNKITYALWLGLVITYSSQSHLFS
jgi:hypothetical protein